MDIETLRTYCLSRPGVTEDMPFGDDTLVFRIGGKIFALLSLDQRATVNLKCEPAYAISLREQYPLAILPGYHMNKQHWNTVSLMHSLTSDLIYSLIDHSYTRVRESLPRKVQATLDQDIPLDHQA
ncbi:MAG: MmcQ/YjbR family DNA-binding protein [Bacteroidia bacterium]|nr:MmcQ/YjbR family DNA-binding protein [Bacteroidia bacterium]